MIINCANMIGCLDLNQTIKISHDDQLMPHRGVLCCILLPQSYIIVHILDNKLRHDDCASNLV